MTKFNRFFSILLIALFMAYIPITQADMQQSGYGGPVNPTGTYTPVNKINDPSQQSYTAKVGNKVLNAFANITTSPLELPKNIINTMNQSNFFYGVFGGFLKGLVNTLGRTGCGIVDLITYPLPTQPIAYPVYIWDDFDIDTTYGEIFRMDTTYKAYQPAVQAPVTQPAPAAAAAPPMAAPVYRSNQYDQNTNKRLDTF
jgi:putative exosortase-associated protein (TIGR04073 family)